MTGTGDTRAQAVELFARSYGGDPDGAWQAPGRVNLMGEHTDYNDGFVLPVALDRVTYAVLRRRDDRRVRVASTLADDVVSTHLDELGPGRLTGWSAYPLGVAWALCDPEGAGRPDVPGFDLALASGVPLGAGLSSSAAVEMATAVALNDTWQLGLDHLALALAGQHAENEVVGAPTGLMDQAASMFGEADAAVFLDCRSQAVQTVPLGLDDPYGDTGGTVLLVTDTQVRHEHSTGGYRARRESCERAARELGVAALRDVTMDALPRAQRVLEPETFARVRHVVTEDARVLSAVAALRAGDLAAFGALMTASHASMRDDFQISVPELDLAVETALAEGALGARMTGGGFGGAAVALVPAGRAAHLARRLPGAFSDAGFGEPRVFTVTAGAGAGRDAG